MMDNTKIEARLATVETSLRYLEQDIATMADDMKYLRRTAQTGLLGFLSAIILAVFGAILSWHGKP